MNPPASLLYPTTPATWGKLLREPRTGPDWTGTPKYRVKGQVSTGASPQSYYAFQL